MNLGVVGSRGFTDMDLMYQILDVLDPFVLISGGARGADTIAEGYADERGYAKIIIKPNWEMFGKRAGFIRNIEIVKLSDIILAFWDGSSPGTASTIDLCKDWSKPVEIIDYPSLKV